VIPVPAATPYRDLDRRIWVLAFARAVNTMGLSLVMAFMALYFVSERGLSGTATGAIYLGANVLQAFSQGWAGAFSDRAGRRVTMVVALALRAVLVTVLGALVSADAPVWAVSAALYASWIVRGAFEPVAYAAVADVCAPRDRVAAFGLQKIGVNLGWALGPAIGGLLLHYWSYGSVFFVSAPIILVAAIAVARIREPERKAPAPRLSLREALAAFRWQPVMAVFLACALLAGLMHGQLFSTFSLYVKEGMGLDEGVIGLLWAINAVCVVALQMPAVALIGWIGTRGALVLAPILYAASFALVGAAGGFAVLAAAIVVLSVGEVVFEPAQQTAAAELADPDQMGKAMGLLGQMKMLGLALSLLVGGLAFDAFTGRPLSMWGALATIPIAAAVGFAAFGAMTRKRGETPC
jgi:MFS family permease